MYKHHDYIQQIKKRQKVASRKLSPADKMESIFLFLGIIKPMTFILMDLDVYLRTNHRF